LSPTFGHSRCRVQSKALANSIRNHGKALTKFVNETEGQIPMTDGRADQEDPRDLGGFVVPRQQGAFAETPLLWLVRVGKVKEVTGGSGHAPYEAGA